MAGLKRRLYESDSHALHKVLDEVLCPICMDHPHNAVLIICSSHDKGCRSYICDTSYRHSNCLDRFKKLKPDSSNNPSQLGSVNLDSTNITSFGLLEGQRPSNEQETRNRNLNLESERIQTGELKCPLCRGDVVGWEVVEEARTYLNSKKRSCSRELCSFSGHYQELRRHARRIHPTTRPSDVDPSRERAWRNLEHQREYGDIVSAIRSAIPGAVVVGDYVIENGDRVPSSAERHRSGAGDHNSPWFNTFLLVHMFDSIRNNGEGRGARSRAWTRHRHSGRQRRYLWGENLLGLQDENNEDNDHNHHDGLSDVGEEDISPPPRRQRRMTRRSDREDHP